MLLSDRDPSATAERTGSRGPLAVPGERADVSDMLGTLGAMKRLVAGLWIVVAACGASGPDAPPPGEAEVACLDEFCITHPGDWTVDPGVGYIGFTHPSAPDRALATIAIVNMEGIVVNAGGVWPAASDDTARAFWQLLEEADVADFVSLERRVGGSIESFGTYEDGRLWHLLIPMDSTHAIGLEVRAPNNSWKSHVDIFFADVVVSS